MRDITRPQPVFCMLRLVRGGHETPACIVWEQTHHEPGDPSNVMERPAHLGAYIGDSPVDPSAVWEQRFREITEAEYRYQLADRHWLDANAPSDPKANPTEPINLLTAPLPF